MWKGKYKRWNPLPKFEGVRLYCEAVHDDYEGFRIWLRGEKTSDSMIIVKFDFTLMYVNSDEGNRLSKVDSYEEMKFPHTFWKVENSTLINEFNRQSLNINEDLDIQHYAFLTCNDCIDILSTVKPEFQTGG